MANSVPNGETIIHPPREIRCRCGNHSCPEMTRFGSSTASNVLDYFKGTPEITTSILFLGSGDLRNVLLTGSQLSDAYKKLNIHLNDDYDFVTARNILIIYIMLSDDFDPSNPVDIDYIWDVWYSLQWTEDTRQRFLKHVEQLLSAGWAESGRINIPDSQGVEIFKTALNSWQKMDLITIENAKSIVEKRFRSVLCSESNLNLISDTFDISSISIHSEHFITACLLDDYQGSTYTYDCLSYRGTPCFWTTGNCVPPINRVTCFNPTLFSLEEDDLNVRLSSYPFEAYLPVPIEDSYTEVCHDIPSTVIQRYAYCKFKLQLLITEFRARKRRLTFYFHFGECLELCLRKQETKKEFQVIHCSSDILEKVGLANIISSCSNCLASPEAVLLTNISLVYVQENLKLASVSEYIKSSLCCPLSLIPTLYGWKLKNHLRLGSLNPIKLHDTVKNLFITLKWQQALGYSENIQLEMSPVLERAIQQLAASRFDNGSKFCDHGLQLYTFYYILQSLTSRCAFLQPAEIQSFFLTEVSPSFRLTWRTEQAWMKGEPVLQYSFSSSFRAHIHELVSSAATCYDVMLVRTEFSHNEIIEPSQNNFLSLFQWKKGNSTITAHCFHLNVDELQDTSFSLLLAKDHEPDLTLCIADVGKNNRALIMVKLRDLRSKLISNPIPFSFQSAPIQTQNTEKENACYLSVIRCAENEMGYELDVNTYGAQISQREDIAIATDRQHPSFSAHQLTLSVPNLEPLNLQVPWPFLSEEVQVSLVKKNKKKKKKLIRLIIKKNFNEPFPADYGGRSKWDLNLLKPWQEIEGHGTLKMHIEAQFRCDRLTMEKYSFKSAEPSCPLDEVREIVRAIFYGYYFNSFHLFFIFYFDEPIFYVKVQQKVRISPLGSPLLIASVNDCQLALQLIEKGALDPEQYQADYHRIFTEGVSRQVCTIRASSNQEVELLRYSFQANSTKMRRSVWQSMNLPRGENSPWIATFIAPLYSEDSGFDCKDISREIQCSLRGGPCNEITIAPMPMHYSPQLFKARFVKFPSLIMCPACFTKKIELKKCGRCKAVSYCSTACQKTHWYTHKHCCSSS